MNIINYLFPRIVFFSLALVLIEFVYKRTTLKDDIEVHANTYENLIQVPKNANAIYFGESSNFHKGKNDSRKVRISHLIDSLCSNYTLATVDNSGLHSGTYLSLLNRLPKDLNIEFVIITMNLRSFAANWRFAHGETYLSKSEIMIDHRYPFSINRFRIGLKDYDLKSNEERTDQMKKAFKEERFYIPNFKYDNIQQWDSAMAWGEWLNQNKNLTKENLGLACHYIKNYAFELNSNKNERIKDFDKIIKTCDKKDIKIVFNFLAENMDEAENLAGENLVYLIEKNRDFLRDRYSKENVIFVDNLNVLPDSCFVDRDWPTEHYNISGKRIIATNIAKVICDKEYK